MKICYASTLRSTFYHNKPLNKINRLNTLTYISYRNGALHPRQLFIWEEEAFRSKNNSRPKTDSNKEKHTLLLQRWNIISVVMLELKVSNA